MSINIAFMQDNDRTCSLGRLASYMIQKKFVFSLSFPL